MTKGEMGSTLPLLASDAMIFSRTGMTALILATGWRPLREMSTIAATAARSKKVRIRFRSLRSTFGCALLAVCYAKTRGYARAEKDPIKMRGLLALRPAGYKEPDCSNRATACTSRDVERFHICLNRCGLCRPRMCTAGRVPHHRLGGLSHVGVFPPHGWGTFR